MDIGSRIHVAAVGSKGIDKPVRTFKTFTNDLQRLADWFEEAGVQTLAMESTGSTGSRCSRSFKSVDWM